MTTLKEERFVTVYGLRDTVHCSREAVVLRDGHIALVVRKQRAGWQWQVYQIPRYSPFPAATISFTAFPKRRYLPVVLQPSQILPLAGDHCRSLGDISIVTTLQPSYLSVHLRS